MSQNSLDRLGKYMKPEDLDRLRGLHRQETEIEHEKGYAAGVRWAVEQASPEVLRVLSFMKGKKITSTGFLFRVANQKLREANQRQITFDDLFGTFLQDGRNYHSAFLAGFVDGFADVWFTLKEEGQKQVKNPDPDSADESKDCWLGWYRGGRGRPWLVIFGSDSEAEVIEHMASAPQGDKMVLPKGVHPDKVQKSKGDD